MPQGIYKHNLHSILTKEKMSISHLNKSSGMLGKTHSNLTKIKISKRTKEVGTGRWMNGRHLSISTKEKISKAFEGTNNPMYGKTPIWYKFNYKNNLMKSSWEIKYAKYLDSKNVKWIYEYRRFKLDNSTYMPDFYLPETKQYIEIKGWFTNEAKYKFNLFKILYPHINIKLIQYKELKSLGVI